MNKFTSFEMGGMSSMIIIVGDSFWLLKDALHLDNKYYLVVAAFLLTGAVYAILSMIRYEKRRKAFLAKKARIKAAKAKKSKRSKGAKK